ncbi:MAG: UTRA domain-containing protein [Chloroflexi bacterium]|nr:UTRA domain-containing protein [Chloroflexota bacterium]
MPKKFSRDSFKSTILDLFLERDDTELGYSRTKIAAIGASQKLADDLAIKRDSVLLRLEAILYTKDWRAIDHSLSYFLPDIFRSHVMRTVEI